MKVRFLRPAQSEVDDAFEWYETQSQGLDFIINDFYCVLSGFGETSEEEINAVKFKKEGSYSTVIS